MNVGSEFGHNSGLPWLISVAVKMPFHRGKVTEGTVQGAFGRSGGSCYFGAIMARPMTSSIETAIAMLTRRWIRGARFRRCNVIPA